MFAQAMKVYGGLMEHGDLAPHTPVLTKETIWHDVLSSELLEELWRNTPRRRESDGQLPRDVDR